MTKEVPITYNGKTMLTDGSPESIGRAEAILRGEQGERHTDFVDELPEEELRQISNRCVNIFTSSVWQDSSYTDEELNEAWSLYSRVESRLKTISHKQP